LAAIYPKVPAVAGMSLVHRASGFSGSLVRLEGGGVELRGQTGHVRVFRLAPGAFATDGKAVSLIKPPTSGPSRTPTITASGSVSVADVPARTQ